MRLLATLQDNAKKLKQHTLTVYFVARDSRTPIGVKVLAICLAAYALSPIDLIPDFIPVIGYLDDLILIPLGLLMVVRLTPSAILDASREKAQEAGEKPTSYAAALFIVLIWLGAGWLVFRWMRGVVGG